MNMKRQNDTARLCKSRGGYRPLLIPANENIEDHAPFITYDGTPECRRNQVSVNLKTKTIKTAIIFNM